MRCTAIRRLAALILITPLPTGAGACVSQTSTTVAIQPPDHKAGDLIIEPFVFVARNGEEVPAERGWLYVPLRHDQPHSEIIRLRFIRFKCFRDNPGPPIVFLTGGPGGAAAEHAAGGWYEDMFEGWREIGDVICCDQRGTGSSEPRAPRFDKSWGLPFPEPVDWDTAEDLVRQRCREAAAFYESQGIDLNVFNTADSADDLEMLRVALGEDELRLWGISYGTHYALAMIKRHETSVASAVLCGVEGPDSTLKSPRVAQSVLEEVARQCAADPEMSKWVPNLLALIDHVTERVRRGEIKLTAMRADVKVEFTLTLFDLEMATTSLLRSRSSMSQLPLMFYELAQGQVVRSADRLTVWRRDDWYFGKAMLWATDAASGASAARLAQIDAESAQTSLGRALNFPTLAVMQSLGVRDLGDAFRAPIHSDVPVLFVSGTLDPRTPLVEARALLAGFPNGQHLIIENAGHSDDDLVLSSPLIKQTILAFFKGEPLPTTRVVLPPLEFLTP